MSKEPQLLLRDAAIKPTNQIIADCLGEAHAAYQEFLKEMKAHGISLMDWRYYNDGKSWLSKGEYKWTTTRGTEKIKPIFWVSIWNGYFKISFNFSAKTKDKLLSLPLSENTKEMIDHTEPNGNTMKFLPVIFDAYNDKQFGDILLLAQFKKENN